MIRRRTFLAALAVSLAAAGGCDRIFPSGKSPFTGVDVTGSDMGGELRLTDHHGKPRSLADFRGKVVVVVFGYTNCPDVCPTTLADMASAIRQLGPEGSRVQLLFVTVDPARDTPELLGQYVPAFHPDFLALHGDAAALEKVRKDFHVYASVREGKTPESYTVDHSGQSFAFDPQGLVRLIFAPGMAPSAIASDLRLLLNS